MAGSIALGLFTIVLIVCTSAVIGHLRDLKVTAKACEQHLARIAGPPE